MNYELIKANLNLYAVLQNLEDLVEYDSEMSALARDWNLSIQFTVLKGPSAVVAFKNGKCVVSKGKIPDPTVKLFFLSPGHLNKMMDGKGSPIPLKGFTRLKFLTRDFARLTDRLEYYLKPEENSLDDEDYLVMNTRLTLNTAAFAIKEIGALDKIGRHAVSHIRDGAVLLKILPDGPAVNVYFKNGNVDPGKGDVENPMACMFMKDVRTANDFMNGRVDAFTAIASGDVMIKGQTPMLDSLSLILDRIPNYLS